MFNITNLLNKLCGNKNEDKDEEIQHEFKAIDTYGSIIEVFIDNKKNIIKFKKEDAEVNLDLSHFISMYFSYCLCNKTAEMNSKIIFFYEDKRIEFFEDYFVIYFNVMEGDICVEKDISIVDDSFCIGIVGFFEKIRHLLG